MGETKNLSKYLTTFGLISIVLGWVLFLSKSFFTHGLIADEFIYFNQTHIDLSLKDFFVYDPKQFFGHGPLLPFIHTVLFKLSGENLIGLRIFHAIICLGFPFLLWFEKKELSPSDLILTLLFLFHPMIIGQSPLLYPEILQGFLAGLSFILWRKRNYCSLCLILFLNTLLRETSLIFTSSLFLFHFIEGRKEGKTLATLLKEIWIFLPSLIQMTIHLSLLYFKSAWNPGWIEYSSPGYQIEFNMLLFSLKWLISPVVALTLIPFLLFFPLFKLPPLTKLLESEKIKNTQQWGLLILSALFLVFLIFIEVQSSKKFNSWEWFHRFSYLGYIGGAFYLSFALIFQREKAQLKDWYYWISSLVFLLFFSWYQAHSARDLLPLYCFFFFSFSGINLFDIKRNKAFIPTLLLIIHIVQFTQIKDKSFLQHPLSLLSPEQKEKTYHQEVKFLSRVKRVTVPIVTDDTSLLYLTNPKLSPKPITFQPKGLFILSMNPQKDQNRDPKVESKAKFKKIDKGEALFLYKKIKP